MDNTLYWYKSKVLTYILHIHIPHIHIDKPHQNYITYARGSTFILYITYTHSSTLILIETTKHIGIKADRYG